MRNKSGRPTRQSLAGRFASDRRGATAAIFAIAMPVLVGMGALAVDVGLWAVQKRKAQGVADQAAYSAAIAAKAEGDWSSEAKAIAAGAGLVDGVDGVSVEVTELATLNGKAGQYWQVVVTQPQAMGLASLFLQTAPNASARAVAGFASGGAACIIGLSPTGVAVNLGNNSVSNSGCGVYSNGNMQMKNGSAIAGAAYVSGTIDKQNPAQISIGSEFTKVDPIDDPYADVPSPSPSSCTNPNPAKITNGGNYAPGQYCAGIDIKNNASNHTINLSPGVYYIGGKFNIENNVTINGTGGVAIVLMPGTSFSINNNVIFNITAPDSGDYAGIAIMGRGFAGQTLAWNNGTFNIKGAIYFPDSSLSVKNNFNSNLCTQLVAWRIEINNNANMFDECPGSGIRDVGGATVALLE